RPNRFLDRFARRACLPRFRPYGGGCRGIRSRKRRPQWVRASTRPGRVCPTVPRTTPVQPATRPVFPPVIIPKEKRFPAGNLGGTNLDIGERRANRRGACRGEF